MERERLNVVEALYKEKEQLKINSEVTGDLDGQLRKEKERKESLEKFLKEERDKIAIMKEENSQLKVIAGVSVSPQVFVDNSRCKELQVREESVFLPSFSRNT